ncbi:zinc finger, CCHC-type containing protein [Tanacetum coccineum]|uniref:Zinc finger, CCHC-type containing protein n=1 Tax=Tanacetum coccineum TaxID=301880 RepID=A0ABQ4WZ39_9ASTR
MFRKHRINLPIFKKDKAESSSYYFSIKDLWGNQMFDHVVGSSVSCSGGILCMWNPNMFVKEQVSTCDYFVALMGTWAPTSSKLLIISVYAPQELNERRDLWDYLRTIIDRWEDQVQDLERPVTYEEVKRAVWDCAGHNNHPGQMDFLEFLRLKINSLQKQMIGLVVSSNVLQAAASLIGCSIFNCSFNYIGVKIIRRNFFMELIGSDRKLALDWLEYGSKPSKQEWWSLVSLILIVVPRRSQWQDVILAVIRFKSKEGCALKVLYKRLYALEMCKSISVAKKMGHPSLSHSFHRMPRGGVEQENYGLLAQKVADLVLPNISDSAEVPTRWLRVIPIKKKMHFLLTTLKIVYVLSTPMLELLENDTVEAIKRISKTMLWDSLESKYMMEDASSKKILDNNGSSGSNKKPKLECWKCGKTGHSKKDFRSGNKKNIASASGSRKRSKDQSQDQVQDRSILYMGDDHFTPVHGKGSVVLEFSSEKSITLFNALPKDIIPNSDEFERDDHSNDVPNVALWKEAIDDEIGSIMKNNTWVLSDLPPSYKPLGFRQKEGIDYFDTYAPVARITTIRLLLALAVIHNLMIYQMDVKTIFLNGDLEEEVYMKQQEGFVMPVDKTKKVLSLKFFMKNMGEADVILGIKIKRENKGIVITQSHYIEKILKKFNREDCSRVSTLMDPVEKLMTNTGKPVDQLEYSRAIGCLMYAMASTRPGIACAVGRFNRFTCNPSRQHWHAITRVFKYLKGTMNYGLSYVGYPLVLEGSSYASWINLVEDSSSTSGWVFLLGGALTATGKEAEWLRNLIHEIPIWPKPIAPISIHCDSAITLAKAYSQIYNGKSRHLGVRHSMIMELIMNGMRSIKFVQSQHNLANQLTKAFARDLVIKSVIGM